MLRKPSTSVTAVKVVEINLKRVNIKVIFAIVAVIITAVTYGDSAMKLREEDWDRILLNNIKQIRFIVILNNT